MSDRDLTNTIKDAVKGIRQDAGGAMTGGHRDFVQHVAMIAMIAIIAVSLVAIVAIALRAL